MQSNFIFSSASLFEIHPIIFWRNLFLIYSQSKTSFRNKQSENLQERSLAENSREYPVSNTDIKGKRKSGSEKYISSFYL